MIRKLIFCLIILTSVRLWSYNHDLQGFFDAVKNQNYQLASEITSSLEDPNWKIHLHYLEDLMSHRNVTSEMKINIQEGDDLHLSFIKYLILGYQNNYKSKQNSLEAFKNFNSALKLSNEIGEDSFSKAALIAILDLFTQEIFIGSKQFEPYLNRFTKLKSDITDEVLVILYNLVFFTKADEELNSVDTRYYSYIEKLDSIFKLIPKNHTLFSKYYHEKGIYYKIEQDNEKAEDFFLKADSLAAKKESLQYLRVVNAWQLAAINFQDNNLNKAKNYLNVSKKLAKKLRDTFYIDRLSSLIFQKEGKYDSAYHYLNKSLDIEYKLGYKNNTLESSILTVQNQTDKLKLDKLELDAQNKKITNWALGLGLALIFGSVIAILAYKNSKRKQQLAEQGKVLQEQRVATLLKEQELTTIDAMIEGQEKERQRIANDLHDDLGGLMANVKLHFNSLQEKINIIDNDLYEKTDTLLDEAYSKIRAIAHEKNAGVMAKQGLLTAVKHMAEKVSSANSISISVQDFGLDYRLENSLEISLFRIIQELITNIIKHAKATMAHIHLTNHGDILNILVEDNGIGFNPRIIKDGMGLKSIDKRISHLEGTFHIESEPGKGSTIIIDIPL